jgi:hypothetical protein
VRGAYWVLRDTIDSAGAHDVMVTFQCAPGIDVDLLGAGCVELEEHGTPLLTLHTFAPAVGEGGAGAGNGGGGRFAVDEGVVSRRYGQIARARRCRYLASTAGPTTISTFLLLAAEPQPVVRRLPCERGEAFEVALPGATDLVLFGAAGEEVAGVVCDAEVGWVRRDAATGALVAAALVGGGALRAATPDGVVALDAPRSSSGGSAVRDGDGWRTDGGAVVETLAGAGDPEVLSRLSRAG